MAVCTCAVKEAHKFWILLLLNLDLCEDMLLILYEDIFITQFSFMSTKTSLSKGYFYIELLLLLLCTETFKTFLNFVQSPFDFIPALLEITWVLLLHSNSNSSLYNICTSAYSHIGQWSCWSSAINRTYCTCLPELWNVRVANDELPNVMCL